MSNDKPTRRTPDESADAAHRARNRTVMLTPDVTGQVRARLQQEGGLPTGTNPNDFVTPAASTQIRAALPEPAHTPATTLERSQSPQQTTARRNESLQPLIGFLVSFDQGAAGEYFELRSGRHIITSEDNGSTNNILIQHETVSPMHAILRVSPSGTIQILDQLSEHGTSLRRFGASEVEQLSGDKANLEHGDSLTFGERTFHVCVIARSEEE